MNDAEVASHQLTDSSKEPKDEDAEEREFQWPVATHLTLSAPLPTREVPLVPETSEGFKQFQALAGALTAIPKEELDTILQGAEKNLRALREEGDELRQRHSADTG